MSDNEALRRCVADLDIIIGLVAGEYTAIIGNAAVAVTDAVSAARAAEPAAVKTVVTNLTDTAVYIYEAGYLVATLYLEETWESALSGRQAITAKCKTAGATATLAVATYK